MLSLRYTQDFVQFKLWTLNDEACLGGVGVKASWTMMLTIDAGERCEWVYGIFKSVEFLLVSGDWFSYNLDKKEGRYIDTNPFFDFDKVFEYTESLLPVAGSKLVNWSGKDDNEENSTDSEEVSEESSVGSEDDDERSSVGVGSEDDNEESTGGSEDDEESSRDSEDDNEEKSADSGDD
ncbi:hypothetical protein POM88_024114 [Heracleum sosnowskyi]|uniref:Uncharacterized protein n=1 Tax=Heracleum sosnowskyi TaxID=360622 RepID=A0AAD8II86_9APIA|nr:hypothetical protein POM88_024114 [Heracleum sosnowskyi]